MIMYIILCNSKPKSVHVNKTIENYLNFRVNKKLDHHRNMKWCDHVMKFHEAPDISLDLLITPI